MSGKRSKYNRDIRERAETLDFARSFAKELAESDDPSDRADAQRWRNLAVSMDAVQRATTADEVKLRVRKLAAGVHLVEDRLRTAVLDWREVGASWADVGVALGLTAEGARKRYGRVAGSS